MKKILIIADGILAKHFLERVMSSTMGENSYDIVTYKDETVPQKKLENFTFYDFDPTSFEKLSPLLSRDYYQIMILVSQEIDAIGTYTNIRTLDKKVQVIFLDRWGVEIEDQKLEIMSSRDVLSSRFADFLPNTPVVAQNVGLGVGEIMEIRVPIGSSYVYRHLASIEQKKWRIGAIYRANTLILPRPTLMIQPNDVLLVIGDPIVLQSVYKSIKRELGQFPAPFGNSIYCLVDMLNMSSSEIDNLTNDALLLHSKISSMKLHIKIINPTQSKCFEKLKSYDSEHISIEIDYYNRDPKSAIKEDLNKKDIGLVVVATNFFIDNISLLYSSKLPIFKIGDCGFSALRDGVILTNNPEYIEKESAVIFDISTQLDLKIKLYNFNPDNQEQKKSLSEHFENLAKLFSKEIEIISKDINPLLKLKDRDGVLQFIPFTSRVAHSSIFSIFSTDMERLFFKLSGSYQLFIPIQE